LGREAEHPSPYSAEDKVPALSQYVFMALVKHGHSFTFTLYTVINFSQT